MEKSTVGSRLTKKSIVGDRLKKKKGKEEEEKKKYLAAVLASALPAHPHRPWVDREPSPPAGRPRDITALAARGRLSSAGHPRDIAALAARGRLSSPRGETKRLPSLGEKPRRLIGLGLTSIEPLGTLKNWIMTIGSCSRNRYKWFPSSNMFPLHT
ncbi:hypothetical protein BHE74_00031535 [Ensete ventricosum]|nr:hypothetical protein BHE74_00031535 [Ensete ventricosum]